MQTFITHNTPLLIASHLDNKRLNKQALEAWQITMTLLELDPQGDHRKPKGWANHPAVKMWRGHERFLVECYLKAMVEQWIYIRGFKSTILDKATATINRAIELGLVDGTGDPVAPEWWANYSQLNTIMESHKKALLFKDYDWYSQKFPDLAKQEIYPPDYVWPV